MTQPRAVSEPKCVWALGAVLGEGPVWVGDALWFVDIKAPSVHRYHPGSGARDAWPMPQSIGCLAPLPEGGFIAGLRTTIARLRFGGPGGEPEIEEIAAPLADIPGARFNDGKLAPDGSFWAGSMDDAERVSNGAWWRLGARGQVSLLDTAFAVTNGPAFDPEAGRVYVTDSARSVIYAADWRPGEDRLEKKVWRRFDPDQGYPDGMTVDKDGDLWVAFWDGACVRRLNRAGDILEEVALPVQRPTSVAVGGESGSKLFVTSASIGLSADQIRAAPLSGGLFEIELQPA